MAKLRLSKVLADTAKTGDAKAVEELLEQSKILALRRASRIAGRDGDFEAMVALKPFINKYAAKAPDMIEEDDDGSEKIAVVVKHSAKVKADIWEMVKTLASRMGGKVIADAKESTTYHLPASERKMKRAEAFVKKVKASKVEGLSAEIMTVTQK